MSEQDRRAEYEICRRRGHQPSGTVLTSNPPWEVCRWCGTQYRWERTLVEANKP